jgi:error-prone DNA polymerase
MPENEFPKIKTHPSKLRGHGVACHEGAGLGSGRGARVVEYAELAVTSNSTFLTGASHPEEYVERAVALGYRAIGISDTNTLAGIVRAHVAAKDAGLALAVGARIVLRDSDEGDGDEGDGGRAGGSAPGSILLFPASRGAYARLCRLLTLGKRRAPKGECHLGLADVLAHQEGMLAVAMVRDGDARARAWLGALREVFDEDRLSLGMACAWDGADRERLAWLAELGAGAGVACVATNDVVYHEAGRRSLQDVLACIRMGCTIEQAGQRLHAHAERHLKAPEEMARLFREHPRAIARSVEVALRAAAFSLDELRYEYPDEACPEGVSASEHLRRLTLDGARARYGEGLPARVREQIDYELALIAELKYEAYFLTCHEIVAFARARGILCQGRGGAANSAVCYCLGITEVDPAKFSLLFERFISRSRGEPPDIDIDFEHERREEVIQHIYEKYGRERAALTAEVITYRGRSAVREVGKAMGLSQDCVDTLARHLDRWGDGPATRSARVREAGLDPADPTIARVMDLSARLMGFPRHLSQHVGGFVITRSPLCELVPIENAAMEDRTVIEWDKDDIDAMGMLKVDILGLGMLTCVSKCLGMVWGKSGERGAYAAIVALPPDAGVFAMIQRADTVGVFQIESRAQMSMLPRLRPACFYDLVIEVAIVRPGPIQGKMVHPYLRRRNGEEPVAYPNAEVERVLSRTLGVPLFQEQAMQLAIVAAGFTPDEADKLRRAMAAWKRKGDAIFRFGQRLIDGMIARGYPREFADRCFEQIKGFSEYGFPESHAASFALLVYASSWLKHHHPAAFAAALINSQPMGFYAPAQIVRDAREHGVEVRAIDVTRSAWDCTLERDGARAPALRLGMRLVKGLAKGDAERIGGAMRDGSALGRVPASIGALWRRSGASVRAMRCLAQADAFGCFGLDRQRALWEVRALRDEHLPLFDGEGGEVSGCRGVEAGEAIGAHCSAPGHHDTTTPPGTNASASGLGDAAARELRELPEPPEPPELPELPELPDVGPSRRMVADYAHTGLSLRAHPMEFLRGTLDARGVTRACELRDERACPNGRRVKVAGVVLVRQRPGTASGVVFITLEDETGIANLILWPRVFERFRVAARMSTLLLAQGSVERQGEVVHVHVHRLESLDEHAPELASSSRDFH